MNKKRGGLVFLLILVIMLLFLNQIIDFVVNIKWFKEVNYLSVYFTKIVAVLKLMIPMAIIIFLCIWLYHKSLAKNIKTLIQEKNVVSIKSFSSKVFMIVYALIALLISFTISSQYWYMILQFTNSTNFNINDPIFSKDISFFMFKLPLIESLYSLFMSLLVIFVIITFAMYFLLNARDRITMQEKVYDFKGLKSGITKFAGKQLAVVCSLILILLSLGYMIKSWNLVYSPRGVAFGASYTDVKVSLLFYKIITIASLVASVAVLFSILASKIKPIIFSVVVIIGLIVIENVASIAVQNLVVKSNEKTVEKKYLGYNIDYTRKAFNIEKIGENKYPITNDLKVEDLKDNQDVINNIKINSYKPALEYYNQLQVLKYYYDFNDIDVDRYNINGKYTQVFVSPREMDVESLKDKASTWQNRHLTYTHGYGLVMNKVNSVTSSGEPDFIIKDIPMENQSQIQIKNPRIYFGEKTNEYAIVNNKLGELDYSKGSTNKMNNYAGKAGIPMTFGNKVLFAINQKSMKFLLSKDITSESKILINRNILERAKKIAPFLIYDQDPYVVANNDKLYWVLDAYTASDRYPFSEPYTDSKINYIRNSVKVVIDSVDGTTNFYIVDEKDPIATTYSKIFPDLFKKSKEVPEFIRSHFKYPEDLFKLQCEVLGKYHVKNPLIFYSGDDLWEISKNEKQIKDASKIENSDPNYVIMKLPNEDKEEMVLLQYFNVNKKNNMVSLFAARMDGDNYGKLDLYKFQEEAIKSPYLFKQTMKQDPSISKEITFWNKEGSELYAGDTVILPIKNSLLYIEPWYIRATGKNSIPQMKRVAVLYGEKVVLAKDIDEALKQIFDYTDEGKKEQDGNKEDQVKDVPNKIDNELKQAKEIYNKAIESQRNGDWAKYGEHIKELGKILENIK